MKTPTRPLLAAFLFFAFAENVFPEGIGNHPCESVPVLPDPAANDGAARFNIAQAAAWAEDGYWRPALDLLHKTRYVVRGMIEFAPAHADLEKKWAPIGKQLWAELEQKETEVLGVSNRVETARLERRAQEVERLAQAGLPDYVAKVAEGLAEPWTGIRIYSLDPSVEFTNSWANMSPSVFFFSDGEAAQLLLGTIRAGENATFPESAPRRGERYRIQFQQDGSEAAVFLSTPAAGTTEEGQVYHVAPAARFLDVFVSAAEMSDAYIVLPQTNEKGESVFYQPGRPAVRVPGLGILLHQYFNRQPRFEYKYEGPLLRVET